MLNIKVADLYADVRIDMRIFDQDLSLVRNKLGRLPTTIPIQVQAYTAQFDVALIKAKSQIQALHSAASRPINLGVSGGIVGGGRRSGGGGLGLFSGLAAGAGLPFTANPQMLAGEMIAGGLRDAVGTAIDLESQFANLRRITGLTADETDRLKRSLMVLSTTQPGVSVNDLVSMATIGGRMGVGDKAGVAGLEQFTKGLARVRLVIQDIDTETLANQMGRVLHEFQLGTEYVEGFGSALTKMDNISTASARDILDITQRLGGTGRAIGLTLPQIIALSSVLKDVGLSNEVAGSSFSQIFRLMGSSSAKLAQAAGLDAKEFADAYRRDPMQALGILIQRFNEFKDTIEGQEFLSGLGFRGVRVAGAMQQLATLFPTEMAKRTAMASQETGSQKALGEAEKLVGETTRANLTKLGNAFIGLADEVGQKFLPAIQDATKGLMDLTAWLKTPTIAGKSLTATGLNPFAMPPAFQKAIQGANAPQKLGWGEWFGRMIPDFPWMGGAAQQGPLFQPPAIDFAAMAKAQAAGAKPAALPPANPNPNIPAVGAGGLNIPFPKEIFDAVKSRFGVSMRIAEIYGDSLMKRGELAMASLRPAERHGAAIMGGMDFQRQRQIDLLNDGANINKEILGEEKKVVGHLAEMVGLIKSGAKNIGAVLRGPE
jgi:TP901 family phage tail tape measure protein